MPDPLPRVALIGVSGYARIHLRFLEELSGAGRIALQAATVVNAEEERETVRRLQERGCRVFADYRDMLAAIAGRCDLCCIPTGTPQHRPMTIAALEAGANVLVEKPLAPTTAEAEAVRAAERATSRWVAVGFQDLYADENRRLKQLLLDGAIGPVRRIALRGLWPRDVSYYRRNQWAGRVACDARPVYDSPLSNAFSHFLNLALFLAGAETAKSARALRVEGRLWRAQPIDNFDTAEVRFQTDAGVEISAFYSHSSEITLEPEMRIEADSGTVAWRSGCDYRLQSGTGPAVVTALPDPDALRRTMFRQVIARLGNPQQPICGTEVALEHTRACELAQALPVEAVPEAQLQRRCTADGRDHAVIVGLTERFAAAWEERLVPADVRGCSAPP